MGIYLYDWNYKELKSVFDRADETQIGWFTEIKEPHGRLIDADVLCERLMTEWDNADELGRKIISGIMADVVTPIVVGTPTVIEAEVE